MTRAIPDNLSGFRYRELLIDRSGDLVDPGQVDGIRAMLAGGATDLVVLSHGWNNDEREAFDLYANLAAVLKKGIDRRPSAWQHRRVCLLGVFWPSKKFADSDLIPGGAAALDSPEDALREALLARLTDLKGVFDADDADERLIAAAAVVPTLEGSPAALAAFIAAIEASSRSRNRIRRRGRRYWPPRTPLMSPTRSMTRRWVTRCCGASGRRRTRAG